ncbi:hypothetical protein [Nonomuraea dietziae]|uniref:hypothetical protein n=1 Tax=Nonomuraea dietziae TaxID=65515 RepID=UPI0031D8D7B4
MPTRHAIEIDAPEDLEIVRALGAAGRPARADRRRRGHHRLRRRAHRRPRLRRLGRPGDGAGQAAPTALGVSLLRRSGVKLLVMSTEHNPVVAARARKAGRSRAAGPRREADRAARLADHRGSRPRPRGVRGQRRQRPGPDVAGSAGRSRCPTRTPACGRRRGVVLTRQGGDGAVRELCERVLAARPSSFPSPPPPRPRSGSAASPSPSRSATCWSATASPST